ncbi:MAG: 3-deoxy-8-phosphooctulonate synthase [Acidobacteria bacterium]|nr:3-deoxy-8-phosphooctulonate synthase [Acidobacteriota bacterium]MCB9398619.1 3-deoxy-8-phosphooctulonate synthase [Acidobacteriota bacterium]
MSFNFPIGNQTFASGGKMLLLAGPCVVESEAHAFQMAESIARIVEPLSERFLWVYKSSFDKANRSSIDSPRGPGMQEGLGVLAKIKTKFGCPIITDIHESYQAAPAAEVADILQIPAFLCRQTDLLLAAAKTDRVVNIKKGQFVAPHDMIHPLKKVQDAGNPKVMITERGTSFGYNNLVVDFGGFPTMRSFGAPLIFDATHSAQVPGGLGGKSGGKREMVPYLARAAAAVGVDGFFMEVHNNPEKAFSDGPNQLTLEMFSVLLPQLLRLVDCQ